MAQLAIINYESASIEITNLSEATEREYADDYDRLVYGTMGFKASSVYYMIADKIRVCETQENARLI